MSDPENVRLICTRFVPVALNLYLIHDAKGDAGDFFRAMRKQRPNHQGLWVVAPDGKVLSAHHHYQSAQTWVREVRATLDAGLRAFGPVPVRRFAWHDPLPFRGRGVRPDGSISLSAYIHGFTGGRIDSGGTLDTIHLTAQECEGFVPSRTRAGHGWSVPDEVARRLAKCLHYVSDQSLMPRPEEVTDVELLGNVRYVEGEVAALSFSGHITAIHRKPAAKHIVSRSSARIRGSGSYDVKGRRLLALALLLDGTVQQQRPTVESAERYVAGVEWRLTPAAAPSRGRR